MSKQYDEYLLQHRQAVGAAYDWIRDNLPELVLDECGVLELYIKRHHDESKDDVEEYDAYDAYFYGGGRSEEVMENFNYAWLRHIHNNPHHWQHWVLINGDEEIGTIVLDMPYQYIIEMICDWWSFSFRIGDLYEIFSWYDEHKNHIKLSDKTRKTVEDILDKIKRKLEENNA